MQTETVSEKNTAEVYRAILRSYRADPVFFVEHALGHYTWSKQRDILRSVAMNPKTAVRACHGSSKTFTAAEAVVWFLNVFDNAKVITTAPTFTQIEKLLWAEIGSTYRTSRIVLEGECLTTVIKTERPDHYAIGFSTDKPARAEGWHAPEILFVFDEAKGIPQWMWDSVRGLLTGGFCRWLVISTTDGVVVGENYYKIFKNLESDWHKIHISAFDTPDTTGEKFRYIDMPNPERPDIFTRKEASYNDIKIQIANRAYIEDCRKEWGEDSVLFLTKVRGEIADQGTDTIIKLSQTARMFDNGEDPAFCTDGAEEAGVDVARGGDDDTVFFRRKGSKTVAKRVISSPELPPAAKLVYIANELEAFVDHDKKMLIKIDDTGVGGGLTDIMQSRGYNIMPINFQSVSNFPDKYPNLISEMWFETASQVSEIACDRSERLETELVNRKYAIDTKGRRVVESKKDYKKRIARSPDEADAFLLCFYNPFGSGDREIIWL